MKRKIGKWIIIVGFILALNPYMLALMIPVVIIGIILVWLDRKSVGDSILWSCWPFMLWYPIYLLQTRVGSSIDEANSQKFDLIFTENFTGDALVISDSKCGQPKIIKSGREQLFIPPNGVLLYQGSIKQHGLINHNCYYKLPNDSLKLIPRRNANGMFWDQSDNKPPSDLRVVWGSAPGPKHINGHSISYPSLFATVGSIDSLKIYGSLKLSKELDITADSLIKGCKQ